MICLPFKFDFLSKYEFYPHYCLPKTTVRYTLETTCEYNNLPLDLGIINDLIKSISEEYDEYENIESVFDIGECYLHIERI